MKNVYETSTALDAHMILNLLEQEGIEGRVDGEYLPGAVGELQAINLVRVMVNEADYERARRVIREWEAIQVEEAATATRTSFSGMAGFLFGLVIGAGLVFWAYNRPVTGSGVDRNGDGVPDEQRVYRGDRISRARLDRNSDGRPDSITRYDRTGQPVEAERDDDFDGTYETHVSYRDGLIRELASDLDQDGTIDYRALFRYGNLEEVMILGRHGDTRRLRQRYRMGKLVSAEFDADGDGAFDTAYTYDDFGHIEQRSGFAPDPLQ